MSKCCNICEYSPDRGICTDERCWLVKNKCRFFSLKSGIWLDKTVTPKKDELILIWVFDTLMIAKYTDEIANGIIWPHVKYWLRIPERPNGEKNKHELFNQDFMEMKMPEL